MITGSIKLNSFIDKRKATEKMLQNILNGKLYIDGIEKVKSDIEKDKKFIFDNDPSARYIGEIESYTSLFAIMAYRIAHIFSDKKTSRQIAEYAKSVTGVDIHPNARIGVPFAIDHGVGIVIGETAVIGERVMLYHGVTLGAKHLKEREQTGHDRHPKIGNNVIIYSNTTILGNINVPDAMIIGANKFIKSQEEINELCEKAQLRGKKSKEL